MDVLNAVLIAGEADLGVPTDEVEELEEYGSTDVPAGELVDLSDTGGVAVQGNFRAGQYVTVTLGFTEGDDVTMNVPVVTPCDQYSTLRLEDVELPGTEDEIVEPVEGDTDPATITAWCVLTLAA